MRHHAHAFVGAEGLGALVNEVGDAGGRFNLRAFRRNAPDRPDDRFNIDAAVEGLFKLLSRRGTARKQEGSTGRGAKKKGNRRLAGHEEHE